MMHMIRLAFALVRTYYIGLHCRLWISQLQAVPRIRTAPIDAIVEMTASVSGGNSPSSSCVNKLP